MGIWLTWVLVKSFGVSPIGTDISSVTVANNKTALVYLQPNNTIGMTFVDAYPDIKSSVPNFDTSWPTILPFRRFSGTAFDTDPTIIYIYYQVNDTIITEVSYNTINRAWALSPTYISLT